MCKEKGKLPEYEQAVDCEHPVLYRGEYEYLSVVPEERFGLSMVQRDSYYYCPKCDRVVTTMLSVQTTISNLSAVYDRAKLEDARSKFGGKKA